ncbi:hypothetical protein [Selenomonas ruminantium]|uniref:hypothetical protein n=1 Tax=Selenomonas ruminantium TaxID=971 RepID=UPI0026F16806|nr:hypothetical protein [Selenomonas ruminantium]
MNIEYANKKVEKYFRDYSKMKKKLPEHWVQTIKQYMDLLGASDNFGIFLSLGLGKPEKLSGYKTPHYSLHITGNVRLLLKLDADTNTITICETVTVKGVDDYHGGKDNWYIS